MKTSKTVIAAAAKGASQVSLETGDQIAWCTAFFLVGVIAEKVVFGSTVWCFVGG